MIEQGIEELRKKGFFSDIDIHFGKFMTNLSTNKEGEIFLAASLASSVTSRGDVCADLNSLRADIHALGGSWVPEPSQWVKKLRSSGIVGRPGEYCPLILDNRARLYLYRYWEYEDILAKDLKARASRRINGMKIPPAAIRLVNLLGEPKGDEGDWQIVAGFACAFNGVSVISGGPGTGKSSLIIKVLAFLLDRENNLNPRVALAAPTGKAASRLQEALNKAVNQASGFDLIKEGAFPEVRTIHRLLGVVPGSPYFHHHGQNPLPVDLLVIDEASMVDLALMSKVVQALPPQARLILLGDKDQLASVEAGAVLGDICNPTAMESFSSSFIQMLYQATGISLPPNRDLCAPARVLEDSLVELKKNYRFGKESGINQVSKAVNYGDGELALSLLKSDRFPDVEWKPLPTPRALKEALRSPVLEGLGPFVKARNPMDAFEALDGFRLLCALRRGPYGVAALNLVVEELLSEAGLIDPRGMWYPGKPVLITQNDYQTGLFNGDPGVILSDPDSEGELRAFFLGVNGRLRSFLPARLPEHETMFSMTVHKAQGSEFKRVLFILPELYSPVLTRELIYTALTRATEKVAIWGREDVFYEGVRRRTRRWSGLGDALWGHDS